MHLSSPNLSNIPSTSRALTAPYPVHFLHLILCTYGTQSCVHPRSNFTFGTILPRIYASPVPAISTFLTFLFPYFYFIFLMFERFYALCLLQYTTRYTSNLSNIPRQSFVFTRAYCSQSRLLPRYNFTFGMILPRIYATPLHSFSTSHSFTFLSWCSRDLHSICSISFIPLSRLTAFESHNHSSLSFHIHDSRLIFTLHSWCSRDLIHCVFYNTLIIINSFLFYFLFYFYSISFLFLAPNPAYFCGLILPSVRSYRGFTQSPVPAISTFFTFLFPYYSLTFPMFERFSFI
jgi:hypothetical protein